MNSIKKRQHGVGLIEVMVSMLLFLVGILGVASMQAQSLTYNKSSYFRTQSALFAEDLFDRMRANRLAALNGQYDIGSRAAIGGAPAKSCFTAVCTGAELAAFDKYDWFQSVDITLPFADTTLIRNGKLLTLTIMWDDNKYGSAGTACGVDRTCFSYSSHL